MATIKTTYRASTALSVTNLHSQPSSTSWTTGWSGPTVDNSTDLDVDHLIGGQFSSISTPAPTAGEIRVYVIPMHADATWPDVFSTGTEGTQSASAVLHDTTTRDTLPLLWACVTDADVSRIYTMPQQSLVTRLGYMPRKYALFVAHSMVQALESSNNALYVTGVYYTSA